MVKAKYGHGDGTDYHSNPVEQICYDDRLFVIEELWHDNDIYQSKEKGDEIRWVF
jgi:hypothetical protein